MNYRFENAYSYADVQKWGIEIRNILYPTDLFSGLVMTAYAVQFLLWLPVFLLIAPLEYNLWGKALVLYITIIAITRFYESFIFPQLVSFFNRRQVDSLPNQFQSVIEVDDTGIRTTDRGRIISFTWDAFHAVIDKESKVIFISDTVHCVIPAKCFPGFLEKDAFVRECNKKIEALTPQGAAFT